MCNNMGDDGNKQKKNLYLYKSDSFRNMVHYRVMLVFLWVMGIGLLLGGIWELTILYEASQTYERSVGKIENVRTQKVYRNRKPRYNHEMKISYSTSRYGVLYTSKRYYWPFRTLGDEVRVWYHPERPRDICFPEEDGAFGGLLLILGLTVVWCGIYAVKNRNKVCK